MIVIGTALAAGEADGGQRSLEAKDCVLMHGFLNHNPTEPGQTLAARWVGGYNNRMC